MEKPFYSATLTTPNSHAALYVELRASNEEEIEDILADFGIVLKPKGETTLVALKLID